MDTPRPLTPSGSPEALPRLAYSVAEAAAVLRISRPTLYRLISRGDLATFTLGRRRLVSHQALADLVAEREAVTR